MELLIPTNYQQVSASYLQTANRSPAKFRQKEIFYDLQVEVAESPVYIVSLSEEALRKAENTENSSREISEPWRKDKSQEQQKQIERDIQELKQTNDHVVQHEQAHQAAGGQYTGGISYEKTTGPDGKQYIVGGEVSIDSSPAESPEKTIAKMQIVKRAALAPADPSSQDRQVAAQAAAKEAAARAELVKETYAQNSSAQRQRKFYQNGLKEENSSYFAREENLGKMLDLAA